MTRLPGSKPGVLIAHRVFSALMLSLGLLFVGIGLTLISKRPEIEAHNRATGVISWRSGEQERAEFYVGAGLAYAGVYAVGLLLRPRKWSYIYLTILMALGLWNIIGIPFVLALCVWWFRGSTRRHFGFGTLRSAPSPVA